MSLLTSIRSSIIVFLLLAVASGCGSSSEPLVSTQTSTSPVVDGTLDDWSGMIRKVEKESFSMGVQNDGEFLYVSLVTIDNGVSSQVMRSGLEIWFDPAGGKEKLFGIRFPLGLAASGMQGMGIPSGGRQSRGVDSREQEMEKLFNASTHQLQLLADGEDGQIVPSDGIPGIELSSTISLGTLTYEMRIPLEQSDKYRYAVGAAPGSIVGISLETRKPDVAAARGQREAPGGDLGGAGVPQGAGGGMARGGTRAPRLSAGMQDQAIKYWSAFALAN